MRRDLIVDVVLVDMVFVDVQFEVQSDGVHMDRLQLPGLVAGLLIVRQ
jgi:hypothetical protein